MGAEPLGRERQSRMARALALVLNSSLWYVFEGASPAHGESGRPITGWQCRGGWVASSWGKDEPAASHPGQSPYCSSVFLPVHLSGASVLWFK